mmetsp:Transcript_21777/g.36021  ORF Transcript_21777/g.36021 Transcript_21777/m.36021 type:complete len:92 (-) Transcript_21777:1043-1318(-)
MRLENVQYGGDALLASFYLINFHICFWGLSEEGEDMPARELLGLGYFCCVCEKETLLYWVAQTSPKSNCKQPVLKSTNVDQICSLPKVIVY